MDHDFDGFESSDEWAEERASILKFRPQSENVYNKLLPYSDLLDDESGQWFSKIKAQLGIVLARRELIPGFSTWITSLMKYIRLYGLKFPKEDHVSLIRILYEFVVSSHVDFSILNNTLGLLSSLLKRKHLIEPEELKLEWKPLYVVYERYFLSTNARHGMYQLPQSLENNFRILIRFCRPYFPITATREILQEFRPIMCPLDTSMEKALDLFQLFLPTFHLRQYANDTYLLWFEDLLRYWKLFINSSHLQGHIFTLYSRLAEDTIGELDWNPYLPLLFAKIQKLFHLPINYKKLHLGSHPHQNGNQIPMASKWIVATLGKNSDTQTSLSRLFKSLDTYFHPANVGPYSSKLMEFTSKLCLNFVRRLHRERYAKVRWGQDVPEIHKLTDNDVTDFVESIKPVVLQAMYSRGSMEVGNVLQILATLRPEIILPGLLDRMYGALDTLTEPHKLTASLQAISSVSRSLVNPGTSYPEGQTHVIPLLVAALPGLDPNDIHKSMATLQFLATFCSLIEIVDCSEMSSKTENEVEVTICEQTASFEDFVIQFLDRCFAIIDSSSFEQIREEPSSRYYAPTIPFREEQIQDSWIGSTFKVIMTQVSETIFDTVLKKLKNYIRGRILEPKVAGRIAASLCKVLTRVNPSKGLATFLPDSIKTIRSVMSHDGARTDENLNSELMFSLLIISEIITHSGEHLLPYIRDLEVVLDLTLHLPNKDAYGLASVVLKNMLKALTTLYPKESRSKAERETDTLPIRDWGRPGNIHNLKLEWHQPSKSELECSQRLVNRFLQAELTSLENYSEGRCVMTRSQVTNSLSIVLEIMIGAGYAFPIWDHEDDLDLVPSSSVPLFIQRHVITRKLDWILTLNGKNARLEVVRVLDKLQTLLLNDEEDDTKSLHSIISVYFNILHFFGTTRDAYNTHYASSTLICKTLENKLVGKKKHVRAVLIDRALLQHESRQVESLYLGFTETHWTVMQNLLRLSTSHYSNVRIAAQDVLIKTMNHFSHSYKQIFPSLVELLRDDPTLTHEQLKGALHVILGTKNRSVLTKHSWTTVERLWIALVDSKCSEKHSIIFLMDSCISNVIRSSTTISIESDIPDKVVETARSLLYHTGIRPSSSESESEFPSDSIVTSSKTRLRTVNSENLSCFHRLLDQLADRLESGTLHWRHYHLAYTMVISLIRYDHPLPARLVQILVQNLIHDDLTIRTSSVYAVSHVLRQQKRSHVTIPFSETIRISSSEIGDRDDNEWLCYDYDSRPRNETEWERPRYIHKTCYGYNYVWPTRNLIYAPSSMQPKLNRKREDLNDVERCIFDFFSDGQNVDKLIEYYSMEGNKGHDSFSERFVLFKSLFRNFGDVPFLRHFQRHIERLVREDHDSFQRCASEIIAGLVRGSKHWTYSMTESMYSWLVPAIRIALERVSSESIQDWGTCFATCSESRDPNRIHWILETLMEEPIRSQGSFIDSSRLYVLQGCLSQQEWRVGQLLHRLVEFLTPYLTHPFQNVRDRLGSVLMSIYINDFGDDFVRYTRGPKINDFIQTVLPRLQVLEEEEEGEELNESRQVASRLLQTVCKFLTCTVGRGVRIEYFRLLPVLCINQSNYLDPNVVNDVTYCLASLSQSLLPVHMISEWLILLKGVSKNGSWKARETLLEFMQVSVFCNYHILASNSEWIDEICRIVETSLQDERVEVREKASQVLSGLLHGDFLSSNTRDGLLKMYSKRVRTSLKKSDEKAAVIKRHSGILGLSAFVTSSPYDVPDFLPDILMILSDHLHDPQPIPTTVKKTLQDFKRTHQDNWQEHKLKFSEDQLSQLTDILVSPSYYA